MSNGALGMDDPDRGLAEAEAAGPSRLSGCRTQTSTSTQPTTTDPTIHIATASTSYSTATPILPPISSFEHGYPMEATPSLSTTTDPEDSPRSSTSVSIKRERSTASPIDQDELSGKRQKPAYSSTATAVPGPTSPPPPPAKTEGEKRKEQNRAAQRAFRERKEKHVRELEANNQNLSATVAGMSTECETLRELLSRVQRENVQLKRSALTCSCSSPATISPLTPSTTPTVLPSAARPSNFHKIGAPDGFLA